MGGGGRRARQNGPGDAASRGQGGLVIKSTAAQSGVQPAKAFCLQKSKAYQKIEATSRRKKKKPERRLRKEQVRGSGAAVDREGKPRSSTDCLRPEDQKVGRRREEKGTET